MADIPGKNAQLAAYYDGESRQRSTRPIEAGRVERRTRFAALLRAEGRRSLLDAGSGPGRDAAAFAEQGIRVACLDLSQANVELCRAAGLEAHHGSMIEAPFPDASFDAGWTMSTVMHLDDDEIELAIAELARVLRPGAPLAIGCWGAPADGAAQSQPGDPRYFRYRTDDQMRSLLAGRGAVEIFETWLVDTGADRPFAYQWMVLRVGA